ncbi:hypothetical protein BJ138DRAFT_824151 [Hygrophoropsis aurantiaca]|uniref:Uncharacterized protein n=1 Tax=Hygrophoropsis aurantiaca TaxID=72124 RepID=A0ACB8ARP4_9AGAM|nr:hypothetical protein BJ138DRAFT_824151 [Hygrophoropsis aurantiaca]
MSHIRRSVLTALRDVPPVRIVQGTLPRPSSTLSSNAIPAEYEAMTLPPIFDIFDAPVRLGESSKQLGRTESNSRVTTTSATAQRNGEKSRNLSNEVSESSTPTSLPPPILFDGPARPAHLMPLALEKRRKMRERLSRSVRKGTLLPSAAYETSTETLVEIFEGPSRITRYKYPSAHSQQSSQPYIWLALGISGAFGLVAFKDQLNLHDKRSIFT